MNLSGAVSESVCQTKSHTPRGNPGNFLLHLFIFSFAGPYDITILYMQDALEWCEYLFDLFSPYDVSQNSENITEFPTQEGTIQAIKSSFVRIAIVSPAFLERCSSELEHVVADRPVVGLLCGVSKTDLGVLELRLPSHKSWTLADAQEDPKSLTQTTMKVLDDAWKDETDSLYLPMVGSIQLAAGDPEEQEDLYVDGTVTAPDSNLYDLTDTCKNKFSFSFSCFSK